MCVCVEGGIWYGELGLRALALAIKEDVVVVNCNNCQMTVYPCFPGPHLLRSAGYTSVQGSNEMGRLCTTRNGAKFTPLTVFNPSTVVLAYNGIHFWYTKIDNPGSTDKSRWLIECKNKVPKEERRDVVQEKVRATTN
jgi:hypothetical protein